MWGNGADFDNAILAHCYSRLGRPAPWKFWNSRCYRTLKSFSPVRGKRIGVHHHALDDAKTQAADAMAIAAALGLSL